MLRGEVDTIPVDYMLRPEPLQGIEFTADAHVVGKVTDTGGYMRLVLRADMPYATICARCLDRVEGVYTVCFERTVAEEKSLTEEQIEEAMDIPSMLSKSCTIEFYPDTAKFLDNKAAAAVLDEFVEMAKLLDGTLIQNEGNLNYDGKIYANDALSTKRAETVKKYFVAN